MYRIDATDENVYGHRLGRLVNHGDKASERNCKMSARMIGGRAHLLLCAIRDILVGEELLYDYGVTRLPWQIEVI